VSRTGTQIPYFSIGRRAGEIPELDGLRGIAILLVLLRHAARPITEERGYVFEIGGWDVSTPLLNGWMGVDLFFVLSGFLITHHLLKRWPEKVDRSFMSRYWSKRVLRTFPAYYAAVFIALTGLVPLFEPDVEDVRHSLTIHLLFLQDYLGSDLVPAFWSLGVEEKFYLLCPLVLVKLRRHPLLRRIHVLAALAILPVILRIASLYMNSEQLLNYDAFFWTVRSPFHLAMDGLWIGVICAFIYRSDFFAERDRRRMLRSICNVSLVVIGGLMLTAAWFDDMLYLPSVFVLNVVSIAFGGVLLSVSCGETRISPLLRTRWLRKLSVLSYSVYLLHLMLVPACLAILNSLVDSEVATPLRLLAIFMPLFFALSLAAGALLHFTVEKPFLLLKDRIKL
jgi:peptidoglycan/LPS O-acetylase OafA/YrhL